MEQLLEKIASFKTEISSYIATKADETEAFRIKYLGTKGLVKEVMGEMKNVAADKKREFGQLLNEFKLFAEAKYEELKATSENGEAAAKDSRPRFVVARRSHATRFPASDQPGA